MRARGIVGVALLALAVGGCQQSKSANPLSPDIAGPIPGVTITAPKNLEPFGESADRAHPAAAQLPHRERHQLRRCGR